MILVTGATGTVGSEVLAQLLAVGAEVRVLARDPARARAVAGAAEIVRADLARPDTLGAAFAGVERAFLLSSGPDLATLDGNAIEAAARAGVKHVVLLSAAGAELDPGSQIGRWHRVGEQKLLASGMAWTLLRPGMFASNALGWAETIKEHGMVFAPVHFERRFAPIDPRDIGAVAVKALTSSRHEGEAYTLTGPEALTVNDQLDRIGAALGRTLVYNPVPERAARARMLRSGMPEIMVSAILEQWALVASGRGAEISFAVQEILERPPATFDVWLARNLEQFPSGSDTP